MGSKIVTLSSLWFNMSIPPRYQRAPSWKFNLSFIIVLSFILGLIADAMLYDAVNKDHMFMSAKTYVISGMFTTACFLSFWGTERFLRQYVVMNTIRSIWIYIGITSLVMTAVVSIGILIMENVFEGEFRVGWGTPIFNITAGVCFLGCITIIVTYYGRDFYLRYMDMEKNQHESQMAALKAQINPHFLFNSLNSIATLVRVNPQKAEAVTEDLADLFRYSLRSSKTDKNSLQEELAALKTYLSIEKARFGDRLQTNIDIQVDQEEKHTLVPGFILQPLVENCIKHGASQTLNKFQINLTIYKNGNKLIIDVTDNGPGFGEVAFEEIIQNGTGLSNIRTRLDLMYGPQANIKARGQTLTIEIPFHHSNGEQNKQDL